MRSDFRSVLTHGKDLRYPDAEFVRSRILDDDGLPVLSRLRARDLRKGWREGNNLRYALIKRYLRSQVGRRWDTVHSDIANAFPGEPDLRHRVFDHYVEEGCLVHRDGGVRDGEGRTLWGFYVDPRDGILRDGGSYNYGAPAYRIRNTRRPLTDVDCVPLTEPGDPERRVELRRLDGVWYAFGYRRVSALAYPAVATARVRFRDRHDVVEDIVVKRQLPSPEIRRLRLADWVRDAAALAASVAEGRDDPVRAARLEALRKTAIAACLRRDGPPVSRRR